MWYNTIERKEFDDVMEVNTILNITINKETTVVENDKMYCKWTLKTVEFFGNVYATLEKHYPNFIKDEFANVIINHVREELRGDSKNDTKDDVKMFGLSEIGSTLYNLKTFIDSRDTLVLTLKDIEEMRIDYRMTANYLPASLNDKDGMRFEKLTSVTQVMIAALYYYAYNDYKLVRCSHCGKWFATKTLKEKYCKRISPCFGDIITGKTPLPCEQAVRNIKQKQRVRYNSIYKSFWYYNGLKADEQNYFMNTSAEMREAINDAPTVENFKRYDEFLNSYPKRTWKNKTKPQED